MIRLGMVDLCTSHPGAWTPIIKEMDGVEVVAVHDDGGVRPEGFAAQFAEEHGIETVTGTIEEMVGLVDAAIVHSANWDLHLAHARPFIEAGVPVLIDKPMVGNLRDLHELQRLQAKHGTLVMGGSSVRYATEVQELSAIREEMGEIGVGWCQGRGDFFNYGIHTVEMFQGFFGTGVRAVEHVGANGPMDVFRADYTSGVPVFFALGAISSRWFISIGAANGVFERTLTAGDNYRRLIEAFVAAVEAGEPPISLSDNLEAVKISLAAKVSRRERAICYLEDLTNDERFDGDAFAEDYAKLRQ
ncbi:MAG: Gfo/Idh/MocA family protein [Armatimonadota bacterium]